MNSEQYQALAIRTESVPAEIKINQTALHATFLLAIAAGRVADQVKRRVFYGKPLELKNIHEHLQKMIGMVKYLGMLGQDGELEGGDPENHVINRVQTDEEMAAMQLPPELAGMNLNNLDIRLFHAAIGCFTESGEKLEALLKQYETGELDITNYAEESGDTQWYEAIEFNRLAELAKTSGLSVVDFSERGIRIKNITKLQGNAKLKGRYGQGDFDAVAALNRDLAAERALLEAPVVANGEQQKGMPYSDAGTPECDVVA